MTAFSEMRLQIEELSQKISTFENNDTLDFEQIESMDYEIKKMIYFYQIDERHNFLSSIERKGKFNSTFILTILN